MHGSYGYHAKAVSLILPFWRPRKIDLTPHQVLKLLEQKVHELVGGGGGGVH